MRGVTDPVFASNFVVGEPAPCHGLTRRRACRLTVPDRLAKVKRHEIAPVSFRRGRTRTTPWAVYQPRVESRGPRPRRIHDSRGVPQRDAAGFVVELKGLDGRHDGARATTQIEDLQGDIPDLFRNRADLGDSDGYKRRLRLASRPRPRPVQPGARSTAEIPSSKSGDRNAGTCSAQMACSIAAFLPSSCCRFVVSKTRETGPIKRRWRAYHQFHAVLKALESVPNRREKDGKGWCDLATRKGRARAC